MVRDLNVPLEVIGVPTVRADDGLALSSRNQYLTDDERARAPRLYQVIDAIRTQLAAGRRDFETLTERATGELDDAGFAVDYVAIRDAHTLARASSDTREFRVLAAAQLGGARLIDNVGHRDG